MFPAKCGVLCTPRWWLGVWKQACTNTQHLMHLHEHPSLTGGRGWSVVQWEAGGGHRQNKLMPGAGGQTGVTFLPKCISGSGRIQGNRRADLQAWARGAWFPRKSDSQLVVCTPSAWHDFSRLGHRRACRASKLACLEQLSMLLSFPSRPYKPQLIA